VATSWLARCPRTGALTTPHTRSTGTQTFAVSGGQGWKGAETSACRAQHDQLYRRQQDLHKGARRPSPGCRRPVEQRFGGLCAPQAARRLRLPRPAAPPLAGIVPTCLEARGIVGPDAIAGTFLIPTANMSLDSGGLCDASPPQCDPIIGCWCAPHRARFVRPVSCCMKSAVASDRPIVCKLHAMPGRPLPGQPHGHHHSPAGP
jgi:hypothetical protein